MKFNKVLKAQDLLDFCGPLISGTLGNLSQEVVEFGTPHSKAEKSFAFINGKKWLKIAESSNNKCILAPLSLKEEVKNMNSKKTWLFSKNVNLTAQKIKKEFVFDTPYRASWQGCHPTALIDKTVQLAKGVIVGPYAVIGENCSIGSGTYVGPHAVIEKNCKIGKNVTLHPLCYIGHSCQIGDSCEIMPQAVIGSEGYGYVQDNQGNHHRIPHTGRVILEEEVHIGAGSAIDRGTLEDSVIGRGTKIDNQCHLAHNIVIGKKGLMAAYGGTAGSVTIGDNFISGGKVAINSGVKITDNVHLAGLSVVNSDVKESGQYGGHPLEPLRNFLKTKASSVHVPKLRKQVEKILKKLFPGGMENIK